MEVGWLIYEVIFISAVVFLYAFFALEKLWCFPNYIIYKLPFCVSLIVLILLCLFLCGQSCCGERITYFPCARRKCDRIVVGFCENDLSSHRERERFLYIHIYKLYILTECYPRTTRSNFISFTCKTGWSSYIESCHIINGTMFAAFFISMLSWSIGDSVSVQWQLHLTRELIKCSAAFFLVHRGIYESLWLRR